MKKNYIVSLHNLLADEVNAVGYPQNHIYLKRGTAAATGADSAANYCFKMPITRAIPGRRGMDGTGVTRVTADYERTSTRIRLKWCKITFKLEWKLVNVVVRVMAVRTDEGTNFNIGRNAANLRQEVVTMVRGDQMSSVVSELRVRDGPLKMREVQAGNFYPDGHSFAKAEVNNRNLVLHDVIYDDVSMGKNVEDSNVEGTQRYFKEFVRIEEDFVYPDDVNDRGVLTKRNIEWYIFIDCRKAVLNLDSADPLLPENVAAVVGGFHVEVGWIDYD